MIVEAIVGYITKGIEIGGYFGIFILMSLESMIAPVPSEIVMPFAGYLVAQGKFSFWGALLASSIGSIAGSLISYYMGVYLGRPAILKFGKYLLLNEEHLEWTEKWFKNLGEKTILISRFIPVVRHLISIPAGIAGMNIPKFAIFTAIGATIWNFILLYAGFRLGSHWELIHKYSSQLDILFIIGIVMFMGYFIWKSYKKKKAKI